MSDADTFGPEYIEREVRPIRRGQVCERCRALKPISAFWQKRYYDTGGDPLQPKVQTWASCQDCVRAAGLAKKPPPPPREMRHRDITRALDEGRIREIEAQVLRERADARVSQEISRAARATHRKLWAAPFKHAMAAVSAEKHRIAMARQYESRRAATPEPELTVFLSAYAATLDVLMVELRTGALDETARADRWWARRMREAKSEHWMTNTVNARPRGRPPTRTPPKIRWARVCLPESVWADYLPEGELAYLRSLFDAIPLHTRARRMRKVPLLLDPERERPLHDYVTTTPRERGDREDAQHAQDAADRFAAARAELREARQERPVSGAAGAAGLPEL